MIIVYTSPGCASCRKVKKFFDEEKIPYKEKNIFTSILNDKELKRILELTENGTEDIISRRSNIIKENKVDIDSLSLNELIQFIRANPSCLKRPIIVDDKRMQVGYNEEEIRTFLPLARRLAELFCPKNHFAFKDCNECDEKENCPEDSSDK